MSSKNSFWSVELNRIAEAFWMRGETFSNKRVSRTLVTVDLIYTNTLVSSGGGLNTSAA